MEETSAAAAAEEETPADAAAAMTTTAGAAAIISAENALVREKRCGRQKRTCGKRCGTSGRQRNGSRLSAMAPAWCLRPGRIIPLCPDGTGDVTTTETAAAITESQVSEPQITESQIIESYTKGGMFSERGMPPFSARREEIYRSPPCFCRCPEFSPWFPES